MHTPTLRWARSKKHRRAKAELLTYHEACGLGVLFNLDPGFEDKMPRPQPSPKSRAFEHTAPALAWTMSRIPMFSLAGRSTGYNQWQ